MCSASPAFFFFGPWHITQCLLTNGTMIFSTVSFCLAAGFLVSAAASSLLKWTKKPAAARKRNRAATCRNRMAEATHGGGRVEVIIQEWRSAGQHLIVDDQAVFLLSDMFPCDIISSSRFAFSL